MSGDPSEKKTGRPDKETAAEAEPVVLKGLRKEFGKLVAVDDLDLSVRKGLIYGMIGPNGSGKTTTIKMLVGLLRPTSGEARLFGEPIPARQNIRRIGYMPQEMAIYQDLTIHENLQFFADLYSIRKEDFERSEMNLLEVIDLKDRRDSLVSQLSGGMRHRTSLACALVHEPELVFLDEPTVGVDPELRMGFWKYFADLKATGRTVILTTHYMDEAVRCDVVGMMRSGKLIAEGPPRELMARAGTPDLESAFVEFSRRGGK